MIRLRLEGTWIDFPETDFELKRKHPIQTSLVGEAAEYSTDILLPLTATNRSFFDYKIFAKTSKANRYIYGMLYVNSDYMMIRCYVKSFTDKGIKIFITRFKGGSIVDFLNSETKICNLFDANIENRDLRDVLLNIQTGAAYSPRFTENNLTTVPAIFAAEFANGRPNVYANTSLLSEIADIFGITLVNAPTNYRTYCNRWKAGASMMNKSGSDLAFTDQLAFDPSAVQSDFCIQAVTGRILANVNFFARVKLTGFTYLSGGSDPDDLQFIAVNAETSAQTIIHTEAGVYIDDPITVEFETPELPAGEYSILVKCVSDGSSPLIDGTSAIEIVSVFQDEMPDFGSTGLFPCWQNLPEVTAKELFETVAVAAGKFIEYGDDTITFVDFEDVFSWENAVDVSKHLLSWAEKSFQYLNYRTGFVSYADGRRIVEVKINDETLPNEENEIAGIDAIRIQDDTADERNTENIVLAETTTGHFDVLSKLELLYSPLVEPELFEVKMKYFPGNNRPMLIRQLGGIFVALESVTTTKDTMVLKLLKVK